MYTELFHGYVPYKVFSQEVKLIHDLEPIEVSDSGFLSIHGTSTGADERNETAIWNNILATISLLEMLFLSLPKRVSLAMWKEDLQHGQKLQ